MARPDTHIGLPQDLKFVVGREPSSSAVGCHLGIGWGGRRLALDRGRPSASGRLAALRTGRYSWSRRTRLADFRHRICVRRKAAHRDIE